MDKIINGRRYNTETARYVATWDNGRYPNDFHYVEETLYCKANGEYFLHGRGGPASGYAEPEGSNMWTSGQKIRPMSRAEATRWAEEAMTGAEYVAEFGEPDEDID